ncbi:MAG: TatD family hydrolase [Lachnospiraceae bacterium]
MIFESHAHYDDKQFDLDRDELLLSMKENGVETIINVGANLESCKRTLELTRTYDFIYGAIGVHPSECQNLTEEDYQWLQKQCRLPKVAAIGEIGLDYYWEKEKEIQRKQRYWFCRQLELARDTGLPVVIHSRDAAEDTMKLLKEIHAEDIPGVVHCFSYSAEVAAEYINMGYYIGIGGVVTFKNARKMKEVATAVPLKWILLETDAPYLSPEPYRGSRNSSLYLTHVVDEIAALKNITTEEVIAVTRENARNLFRKVK